MDFKNVKLLGILGAILFVIILFFSGCGAKTIKQQRVGIKVNSWDSSVEVVEAGWQTYNALTTDIYEIPVSKQTYTFTSDLTEGKAKDEAFSFTAKGGTLIKDLNLGVIYQFDRQNLKMLFLDYYNNNKEDLSEENVLHGILYNVVRNELATAVANVGRTFSVDSLINDSENSFFSKIYEQALTRLKPKGIILHEVIPRTGKNGLYEFPDTVQDQINTKNRLLVEQTNQNVRLNNALKELDAVRAENAVSLEKARAQAAQVTPQFIELKRLEIEKLKAERWNGQEPNNYFVGGYPPAKN